MDHLHLRASQNLLSASFRFSSSWSPNRYSVTNPAMMMMLSVENTVTNPHPTVTTEVGTGGGAVAAVAAVVVVHSVSVPAAFSQRGTTSVQAWRLDGAGARRLRRCAPACGGAVVRIVLAPPEAGRRIVVRRRARRNIFVLFVRGMIMRKVLFFVVRFRGREVRFIHPAGGGQFICVTN